MNLNESIVALVLIIAALLAFLADGCIDTPEDCAKMCQPRAVVSYGGAFEGHPRATCICSEKP